MKEQYEQRVDDGRRIRFHKPKWPMDTARQDPYGCIAHVFIWLHLDDFRNELHEWLRVALINEQGSYGDGYAREDVMDFCDELQKLVEAWDMINKSRKPEDLRRWIDDIPCGLQEAMQTNNQSVLQKEEQEANPMRTISKFCNMFMLSYTRRELWDLLESVIFYKRESNEWGPDPLTTYQCLLALTEAAFVLYQFPL